MTKIITPEILRTWSPCLDGYNRFCELLPKGGTLKECIDVLIADDRDEWGYWLLDKARDTEDFKDQTLEGYRNSGNQNSGNWNSGNWNSGNWNSGNQNSGNRNSGYRNSGNWNSGNWNSGDQNSGDQNSGNRNSGNWNSGNWNSGNWNSGNWNSGNWNSGYFNTDTPSIIDVFNKPCAKDVWYKAPKPDFMYFDLTVWVSESEMTDNEKVENPNFYAAEGYLKTLDYKEAWDNAWSKASANDKKLLKELPNFDAKVFFDISGVNVND